MPNTPQHPDERELEQYAAHTRRSLIARLHDWQDQKSWDEFYRSYWRLIYSVATKAGLSNDEAWDTVQETILTVARQTRENRYDPTKGSFKAWLWQITRWRILDCLRKRSHHLPENTGPERSGDDTFGELWENEWQRNILKAATERVKTQVSPRQFQIFAYYVLHNMSAAEVRRKLGASLAQIYLAKHRVGKLLRRELEHVKSQG